MFSLLIFTSKHLCYRLVSTQEIEDGVYRIITELGEFRNPMLFLSIGTPSQMIVAQFDYSNSYLVVFDSECGIKPPKCPRYCKDGSGVLLIFYAIHILELLRGSC